MQVSRNLATPSLRAWRKRVVSSRRSPTAAEALAIYAKCANPISPASTAASLFSSCSSCSPAQTLSAAAPPDIWQLALIQAIGPSKPLLVVLIGLGKLGGKPGEVELELIDAQPDADHLRRELGSVFGCNHPLPTLHASHYTNIRL